jgi:hypothetical protein
MTRRTPIYSVTDREAIALAAKRHRAMMEREAADPALIARAAKAKIDTMQPVDATEAEIAAWCASIEMRFGGREDIGRAQVQRTRRGLPMFKLIFPKKWRTG